MKDDGDLFRGMALLLLVSLSSGFAGYILHPEEHDPHIEIDVLISEGIISPEIGAVKGNCHVSEDPPPNPRIALIYPSKDKSNALIFIENKNPGADPPRKITCSKSGSNWIVEGKIAGPEYWSAIKE